jgi:peptidase E
MRALLGSGGIRTEDRKAIYIEETQRHFGDVKQILFVPWALDDYDAYVALMNERGLDAGYELVGIHTFDDPIEAIQNAEAISVGGGNTFRLVWELHRTFAMSAIRNRVINDGVPYMGVSAGTNIACPTLQTTNDIWNTSARHAMIVCVNTTKSTTFRLLDYAKDHSFDALMSQLN